MKNVQDELQFVNQYHGNTFHLHEPVGLDGDNQVGGTAKALSIGMRVRFVEGRMEDRLLSYHFSVVDTGETSRVKWEDGTPSMDVNPIRDGNRDPDVRAVL